MRGLYDVQAIDEEARAALISEYDGVTLVNGDFKLFPGLRVAHFPGHTPGLQGVIVTTSEGDAVMASDTVRSSRRGRDERSSGGSRKASTSRSTTATNPWPGSPAKVTS